MIDAVNANLALTTKEFMVSLDKTCDQPEADFQATAINGSNARSPVATAMPVTTTLCEVPVGFGA
jgi:hypothetical protein